MLAKLRNCCRISGAVDGSAAWPTSEEPGRMATARAVQNGTLQNKSRRRPEDVITGSHDSTVDQRGRKAPCPPRAPPHQDAAEARAGIEHLAGFCVIYVPSS